MFQVQGAMGLSRIYVGEGLKNVAQYLPDQEVVIITDENVKKFYESDFPDFPVITIGTGEKIKTLSTVESICRQLIELGCDRRTFILGIGGGIVCDIVGFAASVFMRGTRFGFVSTTLLSQVDASVGGKNGVNLDAYKNMIGVFMQPEFVICDLSMLNTLPANEISNGLAETVKHALIADPELFYFLEANREKALDLDPDTIFRLVYDSVKIKSSIVQKDEKESGERRKLNFGHTIGHALEKIIQTEMSTGLSGHGHAVSLGMVAALMFSKHKGLLNQEMIDRAIALLKYLELPTRLNFKSDRVVSAATKDKKKEGSDLFFVFLENIGRARVEKISFKELNQFIHTIFT